MGEKGVPSSRFHCFFRDFADRVLSESSSHVGLEVVQRLHHVNGNAQLLQQIHALRDFVRMLVDGSGWDGPRQDCILDPADDHIVPAAHRTLVTRGANLVLVGGVVSGAWSLDGDEVAIDWFKESGSPPGDRLAEEIGRLATILDRPLRMTILSS